MTDFELSSQEDNGTPSWGGVCIKLLQGPLYRSGVDDINWKTLTTWLSEINKYFEKIGLIVLVNQSDGYAYLSQLDDFKAREAMNGFEDVDDEDMHKEGSESEKLPRLIKKMPLSVELSMLCVLLREALDKAEGEDSSELVLKESEIKDMIMPYLLRNVEIKKPNQAWSIDITYIPLAHSYIYLTAIIDWYSRFVVGWDIDDTLDTRMVISAVSKALRISKPEILNSDQGCQFTSHDYKAFLSEHRIKQSMDGKGRWADNIMIERWFRTLKYEEVYLTQYQNIREARKEIHNFIVSYNFDRVHSAIGNIAPAQAYLPAMLVDVAREFI